MIELSPPGLSRRCVVNGPFVRWEDLKVFIFQPNVRGTVSRQESPARLSPEADVFTPRVTRPLPSRVGKAASSRVGKAASSRSSISDVGSEPRSSLWSVGPRTSPPKSPTVSQTTKSPTPRSSPNIPPNEGQLRLLEAIVTEVIDELPTPATNQPSSSRITQDNQVPRLSAPGVTSPAAVRGQVQDFILRRLQASNMDQVRVFLVNS